MTYAFLTDGLDTERRSEFDRILANGTRTTPEPPKEDVKTQARRERELVGQLMGLPSGGVRGR